MAEKPNVPISSLPIIQEVPAGAVLPVVMPDGTGTKQVTVDDLKKSMGVKDPDKMVATTDQAGTVKPDGKTITIQEDGTIKCEGTAEGNAGIKLAMPSDVSITNFDEAAKITWTDPEDVIYNGAKLATKRMFGSI